jgi:cell division protein FtsL
MSISQMQLMWAFVEGFVASRLRRDERGAGTLEKIILAAIAVAAAVTAGTIIYNLSVDKANTIDTTTP